MTLRQLRERYRHLFYENQDWFNAEDFYTKTVLPHHPVHLSPPKGALPIDPDECDMLPLAVELCWQYVNFPDDPIWYRYLWCRDKDQHGQRIFVGVNNGKMELHRHLRISERFGVAVWQ